MKSLGIAALLLLGTMFFGCSGSNVIQLPTDKLTAEQQAQVKKDDAKVDDEESRGAKPKGIKKR